MAEAICIRCGTPKKLPWQTCKRCRFDPSGDDESLVKSVYLSLGRYSKAEQKERYRSELDRIALALANGEPPMYIEQELVRLRAQKKLVERIPQSAVWGAVIRQFLPAVAMIVVIFLLIYALRTLR